MAGGRRRSGGVAVARTPGRPSKGPKLVRNLGGSAHARKRLETILETVSGGTSVREACERLGIKEAAFYKMRISALEAALANLEPRPMGRPPKVVTDADKRIGELEAEIKQLKKTVAASQVREELALAMPFLAERHKLEEKLEKLRGEKGANKRRRPGSGEGRTATARSGPRTEPQGASREPPGAETLRTDEGRTGDEADAT